MRSLLEIKHPFLGLFEALLRPPPPPLMVVIGDSTMVPTVLLQQSLVGTLWPSLYLVPSPLIICCLFQYTWSNSICCHWRLACFFLLSEDSSGIEYEFDQGLTDCLSVTPEELSHSRNREMSYGNPSSLNCFLTFLLSGSVVALCPWLWKLVNHTPAFPHSSVFSGGKCRLNAGKPKLWLKDAFFKCICISVDILYSKLVLFASVWITLAATEAKKRNELTECQKNATEEVKTSYQERKKERKDRWGHGSAHGEEEIKGGAAL